MTPCILWAQSTGSHGYGQTWNGRTVVLAHRVAWEKVHGPIPAGMTVDHLCRVKICINADHLRLLSNEQNGKENGHYYKTHCPAGHQYDAENTRFDTHGWRHCRACQRERDSASFHR